jgi:hypothetical protein
MAITAAQDLKPGDIIRPHRGDKAVFVIYKIIRAVGGDRTVEQLEVFPILPSENAPSMSRPVTLDSGAFNMTEGKLPGPDPVVAVRVPPHAIRISTDHYYADRIGKVTADVLSAMENTFDEMDGPDVPYGEPDDVRVPGTRYDRIFGHAVNESRLPGDEEETRGPKRKYRRKKPISGKLGLHGPASQTTTADIPLHFAASTLGLNPNIARFLEKIKIETLYEASQLAREPERLSKLFERHADVFAADKKSPSAPLTDDELSFLIDTYRQDGEPISVTMKRITEILEALKPKAIGEEIRSVWSKFMEEYLQFPTNGDVPDKYKDGGRSVIVRTPRQP